MDVNKTKCLLSTRWPNQLIVNEQFCAGCYQEAWGCQSFCYRISKVSTPPCFAFHFIDHFPPRVNIDWILAHTVAELWPTHDFNVAQWVEQVLDKLSKVCTAWENPLCVYVYVCVWVVMYETGAKEMTK